jgi:hypothetical protein
VDLERMRGANSRGEFCGCLPTEVRNFPNIHMKPNGNFLVNKPLCAILQYFSFASCKRAGRGI